MTTYSVHPGLVVTEIARYMMDFPGSSLVNCLLRPIGWFFMKTPMEGAQTQIYCAVAPELANESGKYYRWAFFSGFKNKAVSRSFDT